MNVFPLDIYTEADGFGDTITVTETCNYRSPDGRTTGTGTATFTYNRVRLKDLVANPALPCALPATGAFPPGPNLDVGKGNFAALRYALGGAPGWFLVFGAQDAQTGAFTTTTQAGTPGGSPTVTLQDATCDVQAVCAPCAPGVYAGTVNSVFGEFYGEVGVASGESFFLAINNGVAFGDEVTDQPFDVTLVQPGFAADATKKQPAVPPVYRVSLPTDIGAFNKFSLAVNGVSVLAFSPDPYVLFALVTLVQYAVFSGSNGGTTPTIESLSPYACDVQMANYGDTLAAGTVSYLPRKQATSSVSFLGGTQTIDNPFPMTGQSFTNGPDASGLSATIQF